MLKVEFYFTFGSVGGTDPRIDSAKSTVVLEPRRESLPR